MKTKIKITGLPLYTNAPLAIILAKFCLLRKARRIGDEEIVNNTQLGKLRDHSIPFEIMETEQNTK